MERIVVDTGLGKGPAEYGNMGDISMLQVAVDRLHQLFPTASIEVLTDSAENLARYCPAAKPLDNRGRELWLANGVLLGRFSSLAPEWVRDLLVGLKRTFRTRCPNLFTAILGRRFKHLNRPGDAEAVATFMSALQNADMLLISGSGGFYDGCRGWNLDILELLDAAIQRKIPAFMLGQGFGPLDDPLVLRRAAEVLPQVNYITLRGGRASHSMLLSLGVSVSKMETTGDEALELAYDLRSEQRGRALGINLRFAGSADTDQNDIETVRPVLREFARRHDVPLIPLPIAMHPYSRDDLTIRQLLIGFDEQSDGGKSLDSPLKVIEQAALCRVVVTGAYHAAVFALGQGIPVVGLAKSGYFAYKFLGLQDQFGEGCQTILLNEPALPYRLASAIERAWQNADILHEQLLVAACKQIELSRRSYERIKNLAAGHPETISLSKSFNK